VCVFVCTMQLVEYWVRSLVKGGVEVCVCVGWRVCMCVCDRGRESVCVE
jgi:hypothetical protein